MPLGLFPEENAQAMDTLYRGSPMGPPQPHWYSGIGTGLGTGVEEGAMKTVEPLAPELTGTSMLGALAPPFQESYEEPPKPISPQFREDPRATASKLTQQFAADPATTGYVGQLLHQVASVGTRFVAGSALGGPVAGAALAGGTEAYSGFQRRAPEMDDATNMRLAAADFLMAGPAALIPFGISGSTAAKMATGAITQLGVGAGSRVLTHTILDDAGYHAQADQYKVLDGQSIASDTILGMAFGWLARNHEPANVPQATVDAAHVAQDNAHIETGLFGDIPTNGQSRNDRMQNVIDATHAELNGEPVPAMRPVETIPNPAQEAVRAEGAKGLDSAAKEAESEVAGPRIEPEAVPEVTPTQLELPSELPPSKLSRTARAEEAQKAETATAAEDPELADALAQVRDVIARNPDKVFPHPETGEAVEPQAAMQAAMEGMKEAEGEGKLAEVAAACFGRG